MPSLDDELMDFEGKGVPSQEGPVPTLRRLAVQALLTTGMVLSGEENLRLYRLGKKIFEGGEALSEDEVKLVLLAAARQYGPLAYGRIAEALGV